MRQRRLLSCFVWIVNNSPALRLSHETPHSNYRMRFESPVQILVWILRKGDNGNKIIQNRWEKWKIKPVFLLKIRKLFDFTFCSVSVSYSNSSKCHMNQNWFYRLVFCGWHDVACQQIKWSLNDSVSFFFGLAQIKFS